MSEIYLRQRGVMHPIEFGKYPSGEPLVRTSWATHPLSWNKDDEKAILVVRQKSMDAFIAAMFWVDGLVERGGPVPDLFLPFVPGARQDRLGFGDGDYLFTIKSVAKMINDRKFPLVVICDPHSDVTSALIDRAYVMSADDIIKGNAFIFKNKYTGVIAPDAGAMKRAGAVAKSFGVPLYCGGKTRDMTTGKITNFWVHDLPAGGCYLVVDDICDGGGTFNGLAEEIYSKAPLTSPCPVLDLYVTHGLFTKGTAELRKNFDNIYSTDSVVGVDKILPAGNIISVCEYLVGEKL